MLFFMTIPGSLFLWNRHYLALHAFPTSFSKGKICPFTPNRCSHPPLQKTRQRGHLRSRPTNGRRRRRRRKGSARRPRRSAACAARFTCPMHQSASPALLRRRPCLACARRLWTWWAPRSRVSWARVSARMRRSALARSRFTRSPSRPSSACISRCACELPRRGILACVLGWSI